MTPVELPKANENLTEATLSHWVVSEGQQVKEKQGLCVIITDKATFHMPCPVEGTLRRIYQREKALLPVGYILCAVGGADEAVPDEYEERNKRLLSAHRVATVAVAPPANAAAPSTAPTGAVRATPAARRAAKEAGVDLAEVARALNVKRPVNEKDIRSFLEQRGNQDA
jgi:pyruvate/2-oxoglutarate dehydrogenase complex dihydrolipoamide acyltransferase (E2) component